jgi:transposase-like protein
MAQGNPPDRHKEHQWRQRIREWRQSGLTVRAFCARHGLAQPSFYVWRRKLAQRDAAYPAFVPVQVVGQTSVASSAALEVVLEGGRTIRVPAGFNAATLRQLLAVLEAQPPC